MSVVHLKRDPYDVQIDRATPWGNPFVLGAHGDRSEVIEHFRQWGYTSDDSRAKWIREHVHELQGKTLGCWCAPMACHGEVLETMADEVTGH